MNMKKLILLLLCLSCFILNADVQGHSPPPQIEHNHNRSLALYYVPSCPYCREVLTYLQHIHKKIPLKNVKQDSNAKEELKRIGGVLEVPCLIVDDQAMYGSETIIEWLTTHQDDLES